MWCWNSGKVTVFEGSLPGKGAAEQSPKLCHPEHKLLTRPTDVLFVKREEEVSSETTTPEPQQARHLVHSLGNKDAVSSTQHLCLLT